MLNEELFTPYLCFISINSTRYFTLTADPALLMKRYSNQSMEALEEEALREV
jgi:hypothetical protein